MELFHNTNQIHNIFGVQNMVEFLDKLGRKRKKLIVRQEIARLHDLVNGEVKEYEKYIGLECKYVPYHKESTSCAFDKGVIMGNFRFNKHASTITCAVAHDGIVSQCDLSGLTQL